jgi:hypothetical protein
MMPDDINRSSPGSPSEDGVMHTRNATLSASECYSSTADDSLLNMYITIADDPAADVALKNMSASMSHHHHHHHQRPHDSSLAQEGAKESFSGDEDENNHHHASLLLSNRSSSSAGGVSPSIRYERRGRFAIWPAHLGLVCPMSTDAACSSNTTSAH